MTFDFKLDPETGDFDFSKLDIGLVDGAERVRQQLYIKLNLWIGEWFLDLQFGTDWLDGILGKKSVTVGAARAVLVKTCMEIDGINTPPLIVFDYSNKERTLEVDLQAETKYGIVNIKDVYGNK